MRTLTWRSTFAAGGGSARALARVRGRTGWARRRRERPCGTSCCCSNLSKDFSRTEDARAGTTVADARNPSAGAGFAAQLAVSRHDDVAIKLHSLFDAGGAHDRRIDATSWFPVWKSKELAELSGDRLDVLSDAPPA